MQRGPREGSGSVWDHAVYLRVAWSELSRRAFHEALPRIRAGVAPEAAHATLEIAWARLVAEALGSDLERAARIPATGLDAFLAAHPELRNPDRVLRHYSPERLGLARARHEFVLPDRLPLPSLASEGPPRGGGGRCAGRETVRGR